MASEEENGTKLEIKIRMKGGDVEVGQVNSKLSIVNLYQGYSVIGILNRRIQEQIEMYELKGVEREGEN